LTFYVYKKRIIKTDSLQLKYYWTLYFSYALLSIIFPQMLWLPSNALFSTFVSYYATVLSCSFSNCLTFSPSKPFTLAPSKALSLTFYLSLPILHPPLKLYFLPTHSALTVLSLKLSALKCITLMPSALSFRLLTSSKDINYAP